MNALLMILRLHTPEALKRRKLEDLFAATADAFQCEVPPLHDQSYDDRLMEYALFTREQVEDAVLAEWDLDAIHDRLYANAVQLGVELRRMLGVKSLAEAMDVARVLYRAIGIDFAGTPQGEVVISRCFFSDLYSSQVCWVISALDSGVVAGLAGGGRLIFTQRITEGHGACRACFVE
jgi:hypothetical protein